MKFTMKPVLGTSIFLIALLATPLLYAGEQHGKGMGGMSGQHNKQMMNMDEMQGQMGEMSKMMEEAHTTKDMDKRHEMMRKYEGHDE